MLTGYEIKPKPNCKGTFYFISRHDPNNGQLAMIYDMGYCDYKKVPVVFGEDPVKDLKKAGVTTKKIGIVAPTSVNAKLLNEGYTLVEFVNNPSKREKNKFVCEGAYTLELNLDNLASVIDYELEIAAQDQRVEVFGEDVIKSIGDIITVKYKKCPIPIEAQEEMLLTPNK